MKLASFQVQTPVGRFTRIGSVQRDDQLIDLSSAYVTLQARRGEAQPYRLMEAFVPPDMRRLIEGGTSALQAARSVRGTFATCPFMLRQAQHERVVLWP